MKEYIYSVEGIVDDFEKSSALFKARTEFFYDSSEEGDVCSFIEGDYTFIATFGDHGDGYLVTHLSVQGPDKYSVEGYLAEFMVWMDLKNKRNCKSHINEYDPEKIFNNLRKHLGL